MFQDANTLRNWMMGYGWWVLVESDGCKETRFTRLLFSR